MNKDVTQTPLTSITVQEALDLVLSYFEPLPPIEVPLMGSLGLVLAQDVYSDMDLPPFDNSSMDGYAVRAESTDGASQETPAGLRVVGSLPAGAAPGPDDRVEPGTAFRIMTGAPVPPGADAVVPFENTNEGRALDTPRLQPEDAHATPILLGGDVLIYRAVRTGENIRRVGEDMVNGALVLNKGATVRSAEIGVLASVGKARVMAHRRPKVAILATGDELVDVDRKPGPGQIRNTNNYAIAAQVTSWGGVAHNLGVARDEYADVEAKIKEGLALEPDLFVTSAGVSVGDYDVVKEVLMSLGTIGMWRVRMRPGKPLVFGRLGERGVPFLGLPGNPVSGMVSMELYGRPAVMKMLGKNRLYRPVITAQAAEDIKDTSGRESYLRGIVTKRGETYLARTTGNQGSAILTSMSKANAFLIVDEQTSLIREGEPVRALMLDWPEEVF